MVTKWSISEPPPQRDRKEIKNAKGAGW